MEVGTYQILYHESVLSDIEKITKADRKKIQKAIEKKLRTNPVLFGKPLRSSLSGYRKLRVGEYRVVYQVLPKKKVLVIVIAHRRHIYIRAEKRIST